MKRITIKNRGNRLGVVSFEYNKICLSKMKLYDIKALNTYRELENYYDAIRYTPYPNQTLEGLVMSYEEDKEKAYKIIDKIKHKNGIEEVTPFKEIRLYGIPSSHLKDFGYTDNLSETKTMKFVDDVRKFVNDNRKFIKRNDKNGFDVDIITDELKDLDIIYNNYMESNDVHVRNYLYPHLRDGYLDLLGRFKDLTGKDFLDKKRIYPLL